MEEDDPQRKGEILNLNTLTSFTGNTLELMFDQLPDGFIAQTVEQYAKQQ